MMKKANIVIINLNPSTKIGCALRETIESCSKLNAYVQYESSGDSQSEAWDRKLANVSARCPLDLIIFILSPFSLNQARELIQSVRKKFSALPIFFIAEKCKADEMFSLLKLGATDFITPPLKNMEILPRLWRLLEHQR